MSGCDRFDLGDVNDRREDLLPGVFETFIVVDDSPIASLSSSKTLATYLSMARSHALFELECSDLALFVLLRAPGVDVGDDVMEFPFPVTEFKSILTNRFLCSSGREKSLRRSSHPGMI